MVNWAAAGLVGDIIGVILVGFVVPRHRDDTWSGGSRARDWKGKLEPLGWGLILLGFGGQLAGALAW
jgi:hypothetical protein